MDLLLNIKDFLTEAKEAGTYAGAIEIADLEKYAEETFRGDFKSLEGMVIITLAPEKYEALKTKLNKIKEIIIMMNVIGCPEGIKRVQDAHPDVEMYLAACDEKLNDHAYIVPGLGDAGDRIFGTK